MYAGASCGKRSAFTLTELLVVIAIMAMLTALSVPVASSLRSGGGVNQTLQGLSGLLEQAREYAIAQDTYVWVTFYSTTDSDNVPQVWAAAVASTDGTDPFTAFSSQGTISQVTLPMSGITLLDRLRSFRQIVIRDAGTYVSQVKASDVQDTTTSNNPYQTAIFSIPLPGTTGASAFNRTIEFRPDGQARNGVGLVDTVELDIEPLAVAASSAPAQNVAVIQINSLTGRSSVYRQ